LEYANQYLSQTYKKFFKESLNSGIKQISILYKYVSKYAVGSVREKILFACRRSIAVGYYK